MKIYNNKKLLALMLLIALVLTACNTNTNRESDDVVDNNDVVESNEVVESEEIPAEEPIEENEGERVLSNYFPLEVGNIWEYEGEGMEYASFTREVVYKEDNKAQVKEDNTGTVTAKVFEITDEAITSVYSQSEAYDDENFLNSENNEDVIVLKSPLEIGTKWETEEGSKEIVEIDASLDTPAGEFDNLIKVQTTHEDNISYEYYKEGIGLVRREFFSDGVEITSTLKQYNIK